MRLKQGRDMSSKKVNDVNNQHLKISKLSFACMSFLFLAMIYIMPVVLADRYYVDDLNRAVLGYTWWSLNGRPLADLVMIAINFNSSLSDISPLTQIFGVLSLLIIPYYLHKVVRLKSVTITILASLSVLACPLFLETISYSFDSFPMMLSVSFMFIPFCYTGNKTSIRLLLSLIGVVSALSLYQAALSVYVAVALIDFVRRDASKKSFLVLTFDAIAFVISNILYKVFIADYFVKGAYSVNKSKALDLLSTEGRNIAYNNFDQFLHYTGIALGKPYKIAGLLLLALFIIKCIILIINNLRNKSFLASAKNVIALLSPFIFALCLYSPLSILELPAFNARVLMAFGMLTIILAQPLSRDENCIIIKLKSMLLAVMIIYSFSVCFAYGNGMQKQNEYDLQVVTSIANDVSGNDIEKFHIFGTLRMSPVTSRILKNNAYLSSLILPYMTDKASWRTGIFMANNFLFDKYTPNNSGVKSCDQNNSVNRGSYEFEVRGSKGIICFK